MKKLYSLVIFYLGLVILDSCICHDNSVFYFNWTKIDLKNLELAESTFKYNETLDTVFLNSGYGIKIHFETKMVAKNEFKGFNLINSAYAKCPGNEYYNKNDIERIDIITLYDFDNSHLSNSLITDYFETFTINDKGWPNGYKIFSYISNSDVENYFHMPDSELYDIDVFLRRKPVLNNTHRFVVNIVLKDNSVLSDTTLTVKLK